MDETIQQIKYDCGCELTFDTHIKIRLLSHNLCNKHTIFSKKDAD